MRRPRVVFVVSGQGEYGTDPGALQSRCAWQRIRGVPALGCGCTGRASGRTGTRTRRASPSGSPDVGDVCALVRVLEQERQDLATARRAQDAAGLRSSLYRRAVDADDPVTDP